MNRQGKGTDQSPQKSKRAYGSNESWETSLKKICKDDKFLNKNQTENTLSATVSELRSAYKSKSSFSSVHCSVRRTSEYKISYEMN